MEVVNETMLMMIGSSLYCITDWQQSAEQKLVVGSFIVYMTVLNIFYNLSQTGNELYKIAKRNYKLKIYKKQVREQTKFIMKKFTIREQHQIARALNSQRKESL